ncbi:MAG TPA: SGNH/GDSL hydrolase family protein [Acidisarcina sp.]
MKFSGRIGVAVAAALTTIATAAYGSHKPNFDAIYVFGDSYSDVGNIYTATGGTYPAPPYFNGRFSNSQLWVEHLAGTYHLPMTPSLLGGTDFAFGGAEVLFPVPVSPTLSIPSVPQQVVLYLTSQQWHADPNALYIVQGGGNDILNALGGSPEQLGQQIGYKLADTVRLLERSGATHILIPRLFDVGLLPAAKAAGISAFATAATVALNKVLDTELGAETFALDPHIYRIDTDSLLQAIFADGSHYGFMDVTHPCLVTTGLPSLCTNPYVYYFWDGVHPTTFGHSFFAVLAEQELER